MNTATVTADTALLPGASGDAGVVPLSPNDLAKKMGELYKSTLEAGAGNKAASLAAMQKLWEWICAMVDRIARVFGLKADERARQLTDEQLAGKAPTELALVPDGTGGVAGVDSAVAQETVVAEASRFIQYLADNPVDPTLLSNPETASEFIRFQAEKLGKYHGIFKERSDELDTEINAKCAEIATVAGTTAPVIRAQLAANSDGGMYDKDGVIKALLKESQEIRLAMGRVELVALSLVDAASSPTAVYGLREKAVELFARHLPGVAVDRAPPPPASIAQVSGETTAIGSNEEALIEQSPAAELPDSKRLDARNGVSTKNNLEFAGLAGLRTKSSISTASPALKIVQSVSAPPLTDEDRQEAMSSSFATGGFAKLSGMSERRREKSGTDWGDHPVER